MSAPLSEPWTSAAARGGLITRLALATAVLAAETFLLSGLLQQSDLDALSGAARVVHIIQHWLFRYLIAYAASLTILAYLQNSGTVAAASQRAPGGLLRGRWLLVHCGCVALLLIASLHLYGGGPLAFPVIAIAWHVCALAAVVALLAAMAPLRAWCTLWRAAGRLRAYALVPAAGALLAYQTSQWLWAPAANVTFHFVQLLLHPLVPSLQSDPSTLTLATDVFEVRISEVCSGLEGVGLMLTFGCAWLWFFRREYAFPRALIIIPIGALLAFALNAVRIAALVLIGDAGHPTIAAVGFHSQAGWIAFNLGAFAVAIAAKHWSWLQSSELPDGESTQSPPGSATTAYLLPLLSILAAGMVAHALSSGFDYFYGLRLVCAAAALWIFRREIRALTWSFSWRGVSAGILVFALWMFIVRFIEPIATMPSELRALPAGGRAAWIAARIAAAVITVPIAEELAYRGYLLRRLMQRDFESVSFERVRWPAWMLSSIAFGITHAAYWPAATLAGLVYGALVINTKKIGESVVAHATTNALICTTVLLFDEWQLW